MKVLHFREEVAEVLGVKPKSALATALGNPGDRKGRVLQLFPDPELPLLKDQTGVNRQAGAHQFRLAWCKLEHLPSEWPEGHQGLFHSLVALRRAISEPGSP